MATVKRTFSLPDDISNALDEAIPSKARSKFIAQTLANALKEQKRQELIHYLETLPRKPNPDGIRSEDILRQIRDERADDVLRNSQ